MRVSRQEQSLDGNVAIPAAFIYEDMKALDHRALKLYLFLNLITKEGAGRVEDTLFQRELGLAQRDLQEAAASLARRGLVRLTDDGIEVVDFHRRRFERQAKLEAELKVKRRTGTQLEGKRAEVVRQINDSFFQGMMPLYFLNKIEEWFEHYQFEPEVIYALFMEAANFNQLQSTNYVEAIAANWSRQGVHSFQDLNRYFERYQNLQALADKVSKSLRMGRLNQFQMDVLKQWVSEWKMPEEAIMEALRRASLSGKTSFHYIEGILRKWHEADARSLEEIDAYEAGRQERRKEERGGFSGNLAPSKSSMGNFEQREYNSELYDALNYIPIADEAVGEEA